MKNKGLKEKKIVLGVTGSIAAYKSLEIIRRLQERGCELRVVMTQAAQEFVTPLSLQTISQHKVSTDLWTVSPEIEHISLAKFADLVLIAPSTANVISKLANGIADDILTTTVVATKAPVLIAPAMNTNMYKNSVIQENIKKLKNLKFKFVGPDKGSLTCLEEGEGRLADLEKIIKAVEDILIPKNSLQGKVFLITAGPTQEPLDPVRYISNYSSGKMGYTLAQVVQARGGKVILVSGPTYLPSPQEIRIIKVKTALEMKEEVLKYFKEVDVLIKTAAVSDYRPQRVAKEKIKKGKENITIKLVKNPDILGELGKQKGKRILVGFAAETIDLIKRAKVKLKEKNLDLVIANEVKTSFGRATNIANIINRGGKIIKLPKLSKEEVAEKILDYIKKLLES